MKPKYRHIAGPGTQLAGQWVNCDAQVRCRNGGVHVTKENLQKAKDQYLEKTGVNITSLGKVPLRVVKDMLGDKAIIPNNLFREKATEQEKLERIAELKELAAKKAAKPKRVVKHFNHESSFMEILETAFQQNEYEITYPITRVVLFDKNSEGKQHFKEAVDFAGKQKYLTQSNGASARFTPTINNDKLTMTMDIQNHTALIKWAAIEAHHTLSVASIAAKMEDRKIINRLRNREETEYKKFLSLKKGYIARLHEFGIQDIID